MEGARFVPGCTVAGKFTLVEQLAAGGMSDIWLAENDATGAEVALKIARGSNGIGDESVVARERFRNEARACAKLVHRNIVRVFDLLEDDDGLLVLVMERLHGCTLTELLRVHGKLEPAAVVAIAMGVLAGLDHAHRASVIHRDLKPDNVFLSIEADSIVTPKLLDFGIAKFPLSTENLTVEGLVLGTPQYMSPEQIRAKKLDHRSDLFSVGTLLHEMLSGTSPFDAPTTSAQLAAVLEEMPKRIESISPSLWEVVARALEKNPDGRQASAASLSAELRDAVGLTDAVLASALAKVAPKPPAEAPQQIRLVLGLAEGRSAPTLSARVTPTSVTLAEVVPRRFSLKRTTLYGVAALVVAIAGVLLVTLKGEDTSNAALPETSTTAAPPPVVAAAAPAPSSMPQMSGARPPASVDPRPLKDRVALTPGF